MKLISTLITLTLLINFTIIKNVFADSEIKITASDAAANDFFGTSVSISGDYAIVGARSNDDDGNASGSAYIFKKSGSSWNEQAKLTASDAAADDWFGYAVSIDGDYAIISAMFDDDGGSSSGSAYIFVRTGTSWTQQAKLTASDAAAGDWFGVSVAISGDYAIVGAYLNDDFGNDSGSAYIFKRNGNSWNEQVKLTANDAAAGDWFGVSVAISGDYAIVSSYLDDDFGNESGSAYIFNRNGSTWNQQAKLTANDAANNDLFGASVAISDNYVIVGSRYDDDFGSESGSAYIFERNGTSWNQEAKLTASDAASNDKFGFSVAIDSGKAVIGVPDKVENGNTIGAAYIFHNNGASWTEQAKVTANDADIDDRFGYSISINGNSVIVGARLDDDNGTDSGSAYLFSGTDIGLSIENDKNLLKQNFVLGQNFPNPFNPITTINFQVDNSQKINLSIYNLKGELVKVLVNKSFGIGYHNIVWNGKDNLGKQVSNGIYFYKMIVDGKFSETKKMILLK